MTLIFILELQKITICLLFYNSKNRDWIQNTNRVNPENLKGIMDFIQVANKHVNDKGHTKCPYQKCSNCRLGTLREIQLHLATNRMSYNYTT